MTRAISPAGLALIQEFEGFRADPAQLPDGNWVVGHGHVRAEQGQPVTEAEAADLLEIDVIPFEAAINAHVLVDLTQTQFDALVSFAMSVGVEAFVSSQVLRRVNGSAFIAASGAMDAWRKADVDGETVVVDALVRRRAAEKALFLKDLAHAPTPSVLVRAKLDYAALVLGAPVNYAPAPSVPALAPKRAAALLAAPNSVFDDVAEVAPVTPGQRLTQILKSEPATEVLLLTQVAPQAEMDDEGEIITAHAKPVARTIEAFRAAKPDSRIKRMRKRAEWLGRLTALDFGLGFEAAGLAALFVFGLGLTVAGGALFYASQGDAIQLAGATAFAAPGLAAMLLAGVGLFRGPQTRAIAAIEA